MVVFWSPVAVSETSDVAPVPSKDLLDIHTTKVREHTLAGVRDVITTYSQMHYTYNFSEHSSFIWPFRLSG